MSFLNMYENAPGNYLRSVMPSRAVACTITELRAAPRHFSDGHISDGHISDGHILDGTASLVRTKGVRTKLVRCERSSKNTSSNRAKTRKVFETSINTKGVRIGRKSR